MSLTKPLRVLVCGTNFGRFYIEAVRARPGYALAGLLARGSTASRACARRLGVPLYTAVDQVPDDTIDLACVVVGSTISGGAGTELAMSLLGQGIHVLQEHPVHLDEFTACVKLARRHRVQYRLNTHYPHVAPVASFTAAARRLTERRTPLFVDAATPVHLMHPLVDILGRALGSLRPWRFADPAPAPEDFGPQPFRTVQGVLGGVPLTLRVHHQLDPADRDNHALHWHRVAIGTEGGVLTLADTHGPVLWSPRLHAHRDADRRFVLEGPGTEHLGLPTTSVVGATVPFNEVFADLWPQAIGHALDELRDAVAESRDPLRSNQYELTVCRIWSELAAVLGPPQVVRPPAPQPLAAHELFPDHHEPDTSPVRAPDDGAASDAPGPVTAAPYTPSAEFFDLVAGGHTATSSGPAVARALAGIDTADGPIVDIGAGTGLVTEAVARALPDAEILACEPATGMRAVLTSRVFGDPDLRRRVTVTDGSAPDLELPDRISAAVLCGVLGHLDTEQRRYLWERLRERLSPGGRVVVELMGVDDPVALPATRMATAHAGRHRYEWWLDGAPDPEDPSAMRLHSTYRVFDAAEAEGADPLREVHDSYRWIPFGLDRVAEESGLRTRPLTGRTGGPPLAMLTHHPIA
ncbi:Gfo/Idh/MocA family oxidoreductase [Actinoallomurus spadix]|uniref:Gfo/Idh/MocA family oxidoreductase n=1 Tax=Actinoallomurus spadix TaxID=79912 RepID=A0ABN0WE10_9ACTN|nr:Gfo/Idh/MocA family oxidoreductase [Actinoallomurus spadix]MCO5987224.1 Gfo/Idh/MocA family oxidoreductase [Actinoallomurus spadix]